MPKHFRFWPKGRPFHLELPQTSLYYNLEVSATRYPGHPATVFYDSILTYSRLRAQVDALAGWLQQHCGVQRGDRVLLGAQNSPQFVIGFYAILRADAFVVPLNSMLKTEELRHYVEDSGAKAMICTQDVFAQAAPLLGQGSGPLAHALVGAYSDYLTVVTDQPVPEFVRAPLSVPAQAGVTFWQDALAQNLNPAPHLAGPDDWCVMPYTSGTTGKPKGCVHKHRSVMHNTVGGCVWNDLGQSSVSLGVVPMFHVTGMVGALHAVMYAGATVVILPRWDRDVAAAMISRYKVSHWTNIPTMVVDLLANPRLAEYDLSSLRRIGGGGAAMPEAIAQKLRDLWDLSYVEGYGLSETIAPSHQNPPERAKKQCLGIPIFDTDCRIINPDTLEEVADGETGEIITHGPEVFEGYWNDPDKTAAAFIQHDGKKFFRTGDLARIDEDGYYFMVDRLKRMINASGFKVWPAEVELMLYRHPAIQEACIIGTHDERRGETVKAVIVLKPAARDTTTAQDIIAWARENMAVYKAPCIVEFVDTLPKSGTGKIMWRMLQEREAAKAAA